MIQLVEYGIFNNMNPNQAGKLIFSILWLLLFILASSTLLFIKNILGLLWLITISIVFLFGCVYASTSNEGELMINRDNHYLIWSRKNKGILNGLEWLYVIGIIIPIFLLMNYYNWDNLGLYLIIIYLIVSALIVRYLFDTHLFGSLWSFCLIGMVMMIWFVNMFHA